jgi:putative flippase GtrA
MSNELIRILIFAAIGVWNTGFDLAIFISLLNTLGKLPIWEKSKIKAATVFHICSFLAANLLSYVLNSNFTFKSGESRGFIPYFIVTLVALGASTAFIQYFNKPKFQAIFHKQVVAKLPKNIPILNKLKINDKSWAIILKLSSVLISMVINYLGYRNLVFIGVK